jgi:hypothetical protein
LEKRSCSKYGRYWTKGSIPQIATIKREIDINSAAVVRINDTRRRTQMAVITIGINIIVGPMKPTIGISRRAQENDGLTSDMPTKTAAIANDTWANSKTCGSRGAEPELFGREFAGASCIVAMVSSS